MFFGRQNIWDLTRNIVVSSSDFGLKREVGVAVKEGQDDIDYRD